MEMCAKVFTSRTALKKHAVDLKALAEKKIGTYEAIIRNCFAEALKK